MLVTYIVEELVKSMPTFVVEAKCKNNGKCEEICPSDIMRVDPVLQKSYNIEPDMCWECLSCVKLCPEKAIEIRPYADISPLGSEIAVERNEETNRIKWNIKYRDQRTKEFDFAIRTTPWDSIKVPGDESLKGITLEGEELSGEPDQLMTGNPLPVPKKASGGA